jgi:transposase InsO family protein
MGWNSTSPMNERIKFIARYLTNELTFTALCDEFGISRKTGYKWVHRYDDGGASALEERSRAPLTHPHAYSDDIVNAVVALRQEHPRWGARKLLVLMRRRYPDLKLPEPSTVNDMLSRRGLLRSKGRSKKLSPEYGQSLRNYDAPNSVWCADFKGHFPVGGVRCHPLTISDGYSRFLLGCEALRQPRFRPVKLIFERVFRNYGLPDVIRTDNGPPFSSLAIAGLSELAVWWLRLGIMPERILPGRPDQNGRHERMHRTLKAETASPAKSNLSRQQRCFDEFRQEYNFERPHEGIGQRTPSELYKRSSREFPAKLTEPEYPAHFVVERAYSNGHVRLEGISWYVSTSLKNELLGFEPLSDGRWCVHFAKLPLGILDPKHHRDLEHERVGRTLPLDGAIWQARPHLA